MLRATTIVALLATIVFGSAISAQPASAQPASTLQFLSYANSCGPYRASSGYYGGETESVTVTTQKAQSDAEPEWSTDKLRAPIVDVAYARVVCFGDLDLRTSDGIGELRNRLHFAAWTLCDQLNSFYPVSAEEDGSGLAPQLRCYHRAFGQAIHQALLTAPVDP